MEILLYIAIFVAGFVVGEIVLAYKLKSLLEQYIELEDEGDESDPATVFKLKTEKINETLFLYDNKDVFVCQGSTLEELAQLADKNKNIKYAAVMHDEKIYMFIDGAVQQAV